MKGPSTQCLRSLVPSTIKGPVFGTRVLKCWVLGPSPAICSGLRVDSVVLVVALEPAALRAETKEMSWVSKPWGVGTVWGAGLRGGLGNILPSLGNGFKASDWIEASSVEAS